MPKNVLDKAISYIKQNKVIRDVLVSGGDPLTLNNDRLDYILSELRSIPHVEVIRIGTRVLVTNPYRIDNELCNIIKKYHPVWVMTQFNHPKELTKAAIRACDQLTDSGVPLSNQTVLLRGVNDCPSLQKELVQNLVQNRIRPYYLYQCDLSEGIEHFRTPVAKGIEIIEHLRGHTSGYAVPNYVIDAPGGGGKVPINPSYTLSQSPGEFIIRNHEGRIVSYPDPDCGETHDSQSCQYCKQARSSQQGVASLFQKDKFGLQLKDIVRKIDSKKMNRDRIFSNGCVKKDCSS